LTRITGTLHKDTCTFLKIISLLILVRTRKVSGKSVEKIKTHIYVK